MTPPRIDPRRAARWRELTDLTDEQIAGRAADAACGYASGQYSSGFDAGWEHSDALPNNTATPDRSIRAWGDFLIDVGSTATATARLSASSQDR